MRGSDVDAALHYLARMLEAGEDPRFIARRIVIAASEDVGMADPTALQTAVAAMHAVAQIGMPEARIILAQAVVHNALAPKSNAGYPASTRRSPTSAPGAAAPCRRTCGAAGTPAPSASATARATSTPTTSPTGSPRSSTSRTTSHDAASTTGRPNRGFEERLRARWEWLSGRLGRTPRTVTGTCRGRTAGIVAGLSAWTDVVRPRERSVTICHPCTSRCLDSANPCGRLTSSRQGCSGSSVRPRGCPGDATPGRM